jgi:DNA-binding ferritin-like protein
MTTAISREHAIDVTNPSDTAVLRDYLRTILTHLVDLHVEGKHADALFIGVKSAALHLHFDAVVESALEAIEIIADRLRALDFQSELNRRTPVEGCARPSRYANMAAATAIDAAKPTADLIRRIVTVRTLIGAVDNRIRDEDPWTATLLSGINCNLATQAVTLRNLSVAPNIGSGFVHDGARRELH